jgi:hypothetical protein
VQRPGKPGPIRRGGGEGSLRHGALAGSERSEPDPRLVLAPPHWPRTGLWFGICDGARERGTPSVRTHPTVQPDEEDEMKRDEYVDADEDLDDEDLDDEEEDDRHDLDDVDDDLDEEADLDGYDLNEPPDETEAYGRFT